MVSGIGNAKTTGFGSTVVSNVCNRAVSGACCAELTGKRNAEIPRLGCAIVSNACYT